MSDRLLGNALAVTVSISPDKGIEGTLAIINGSELPPNDRVDIEWTSTGQVAENVPTDGNGNFTVTIVAPKSAPINEPSAILVFIKDGPLVGGTSFTVTDKEPVGCLAAYFIGLHGTGEGPDSVNGNLKLSWVIGETWDHFYSLAQLDGKNVRGYAIDYPAAAWNIFPQLNALQGAEGLKERVGKILESCPLSKNAPYIVLAGYSLGAWTVNKWLVANVDFWPWIRAVELYGDPLWHREGKDLNNNSFKYEGVARALGLEPGPNPYVNNPPGPESGILKLANRWQSRCLKGDPICGEGYNGIIATDQLGLVVNCTQFDPDCEHKKYTIRQPGSPYKPMRLY